MYTKGTVLLVCFQCVDTLVFESKHAEGMSLRYGEIVNFDTLSQKNLAMEAFFVDIFLCFRL